MLEKIGLISALVFTGFFIMGPVFIKPLKLLFRLGIYFLIGGILLFVLNLILNQLGLRVAVNPATLLTAGVLQLPGMILLAVLGYFMT